MKETKSHFTIDKREKNSVMGWFLIDTDESLKTKMRHVACITFWGRTIQDEGGVNTKYLVGRDNLLPHPTISDYFKASDILKENGKVYNKKKGTLE